MAQPLLLATCCAACLLTLGAFWVSNDSASFRVRQLLDMPKSIVLCRDAPKNKALSSFVRSAIQRSDSFEGFIMELKASLDRHPLPTRTIDFIFDSESIVRPNCDGDFMEFGVYQGGTINKTARWRRQHCPASCPPVYGFDTFTGLPEDWVGDDTVTFRKNDFSLGGKLPPVELNAQLVKGLFSDSIPGLLQKQQESALSRQDKFSIEPLAYLHVDCDLFAGALDALTLLSEKIVPGTILLFDELINYNRYRENEVKALWMWLQVTGAQLATIGTMGPLPGTDVVMDANVATGHGSEWQSAGFVVVRKPGSPTDFWS